MENIFDLKLQRTTRQAWSFYFLYLILGVFLMMLIGYLSLIFVGEYSAFDLGMRIGQFSAVMVTMILGVLMLKAKGLMQSGKAVFTVVLAVSLSMLAGLLGGLIPLAILSKKPSRNNNEAETKAVSDIEDIEGKSESESNVNTEESK